MRRRERGGYWMGLMDKLLQFLYPEKYYCVYCEGEVTGWQIQYGLCRECFHKMNFFHGKGIHEENGLMEQYFDLVHGVVLYQGVVKDLLYRFKYYGERDLSYSLVELMVTQYSIAFQKECWDGILPVPLHQEKLEQRGFNQAELLGEGLGFYLGIPSYNWLERVKATLPQNQLKPGERLENLRDAFRVKSDVVEGKLRGCSWLIVDDIFTTGTTCNELARVLKVAGAKRVGVYTVASGRKM